jgi:hypothetical protein
MAAIKFIIAGIAIETRKKLVKAGNKKRAAVPSSVGVAAMRIDARFSL